MKTTSVTPADLRGSVLAVPPMPRNADGSFHAEGNRRVLAHLRAGSVTTFMYGGNANFYNLGVAELGRVLDSLTPLLAAGDWLIPSVGADYGKAAEQIDLLRERAFPTAMVLPLRFPATPAGAASGIGKLAARYGKPVIAYVKDEGYIDNKELAALVKDGAVCAVKYAIVRDDPKKDAVLADLVQRVDPNILISGIGERPVIDHFRSFGLRAFTSGSTCVAPALSNRIREALHANDDASAAATRELFIPLEDARDKYSPIRILHAAVELAGIAATGPIGEFLSVIGDPKVLAELAPIARALLAHNDAALGQQRQAA
ncbi:dihydrodipicolinate synthase family protein [uncultured Ramlibacter sp.]|uniref:dihydrodipicolinate synthase family protein n=1 Tax=uncultured Ramlibacter sp. TaxID=260755 RepID=UPI00263490D3|nr:dihydrodipicolinate synthase family protein [uncultured Ramlibacter sp.]